MDEIEKLFDVILQEFEYVKLSDVPNIELYMDQVTTFMDRMLSGTSRDPEHDKILTKTMINNYTKNNVLIPPVKKKYGLDHIILLLMIYYMKSFLSISDIANILAPVKERYIHETAGDRNRRQTKAQSQSAGPGAETDPEKEITLEKIYQEIFSSLDKEMDHISDNIRQQISLSGEAFADADGEDREILQKFDLICRLSADIYIKKLLIERILDEHI